MDAAQSCPRCGRQTSELIPVDTGMKLALQQAGDSESAKSVCPICYNELAGAVSRGAQLRLEAKAKERNRQMLWKSRVNLVKKARQLMAEKAFSDAAVHYEKYLRVLEMSYELKKGQLTPDVFGKTKRSKEITVVASTYWDLFRIYDTTTSYRDRMRDAANKLAAFLPFSPIFPDVVRRAQEFLRGAKNPDIVKEFLKKVNANNPRCFIATAVYPYPYCPEIIALRKFRDQFLLTNAVGRKFVLYYYKFSPALAIKLQQMHYTKKVIRTALNLFVKIALKKFKES